MSGWIKVEKDLANDPRVLRMSSRLSHADVTLGSRSRLVVVGALVTLWWYADTHIGDDDVLGIGADEIDELVGLKGFCALMPPDWLQVLDAEHVKLIDYTGHNGSEAKNRALAQKRQQRHREKPTSTSRSRHADVTQSALPDKTRQDNTKTEEKKEIEAEKRASRAPTAKRLPDDFSLTDDRKATAKAEGADADREFAKFTDHWRAASGANARKHDWDAAWRNWCRKSHDMRPNGRAPPAEEPKLTWRPSPDEDDERAGH
jgi:hypothetical protein